MGKEVSEPGSLRHFVQPTNNIIPSSSFEWDSSLILLLISVFVQTIHFTTKFKTDTEPAPLPKHFCPQTRSKTEATLLFLTCMQIQKALGELNNEVGIMSNQSPKQSLELCFMSQTLNKLLNFSET